MATPPALTQWHAYCEYCEAVRAFKGIYELVVRNDSGVWVYTLMACPNCDSPNLVVQEPYGDGDLSEPVQSYPVTRGAQLYGVPASVRTSFLEAVNCLERAGAPTATAIMCRRTLEVLCEEHNAGGRDLKSKLESLHASDFIDKNLLDWATELRFLGNEAAHGFGAVDRKDAADAVEFTEAMLSYVYTYRQSFSAFKERRSASMQAKAKRKATKKQMSSGSPL